MVYRKNKEDYNKDWEKDIAAFDAEMAEKDREFKDHNVILVGDTVKHDLTIDEKEIFELFLNGLPCSEIAKQYGVDEDTISGLVEIIRAKLSIED